MTKEKKAGCDEMKVFQFKGKYSGAFEIIKIRGFYVEIGR